ncbi:MAG: hypothetical protein HKN08_07155 [Gammaproteobacteria bacterium]|nr:hypothetical protein [Gammaproteobacteria bacterium]
MSSNILDIPKRKTANGMKVETRPMYIEEWLDELPYIDFKKTSALLAEATGLTNEQDIKPTTRMELVELYDQPYQYYIDSQIKAGAQHTLQSIEAAQEQIRVLKKIATNLAHACRLSADDTLKKKTLWKQTKPPLANLLFSMNYLSHALIFSYLEYSPAPKGVWKEINFIYDFAESLQQANTTVAIPDSFTNISLKTISGTYKRIVMSSLADPHHLPYGAIWEIYEQLNHWVERVQVSPFSQMQDDFNLFIVNLGSDNNPIPYSKFNLKKVGDKHRIINARNCYEKIQDHLRVLESGRRPDKSIKISPYFAKILLEHLSIFWGRPPKRSSPRKQRSGKLKLACGINEVYFFINNEEEFTPPIPPESEDEIDSLDTEQYAPQSNHTYKTDEWELIDQSARGFAVIRNLKPEHSVKVGDLVIIDTKKTEKKWAIGTVRWLMIMDGQLYRIGAQIISTHTQAAAVRACSGNSQDMRFRRALIIGRGTGNGSSIITSKGMYIKSREIELNINEKNIKTKIGDLLESTTGFEQFSIDKKLTV